MRCLLKKYLFFQEERFQLIFALSTTGRMHRLSNRIYPNDVLHVSDISIE